MEVLIIILVIVLLFGAKRIPEVAKGLGKGIREFKKAKNELELEEDSPPQKAESGSGNAKKTAGESEGS